MTLQNKDFFSVLGRFATGELGEALEDARESVDAAGGLRGCATELKKAGETVKSTLKRNIENSESSSYEDSSTIDTEGTEVI